MKGLWTPAAGMYMIVFDGVLVVYILRCLCFRSAELLLSMITEAPAPNLEYLSQKLKFVDDKILDANDDAVMMGWEGTRLHPLLCSPCSLLVFFVTLDSSLRPSDGPPRQADLRHTVRFSLSLTPL
jgi:hypothetical protein